MAGGLERDVDTKSANNHEKLSEGRGTLMPVSPEPVKNEREGRDEQDTKVSL